MREHPAGLSIRTIAQDDLDAADKIVVAAYESGRSRRPELGRCLRVQPDGWFLALLDGRPAGMGGAVDYGPWASVGLMAVLPAAQRRGVGAALVAHILAWLDARGCPLALLSATEAGAPLYRRYGFVDDGQSLVFHRDDEASSLSRPAARGASLAQASDLPDIAAFDAPLFGADRSTLLSAYYADFPTRTFMTRDEQGRVTGYLCA